MNPTHPLAIWALAVAAASCGLRARIRDERSGRAYALAALRLAARIPAPGALIRLADRGEVDVLARAAGLSVALGRSPLVRARAGLATAGLVTGAALALIHPLGAALGAGLAGLGFVGPVHWIARRARVRARQIVRELPDLIDLLVICTASGMAVESALRLTAERLPGPLTEEVALTLRELDLGTPRREAFRGLASRIGAPELTSFVGALLQADELGAPIAATLEHQGELLRASRRQDVRERAAKAAPKVQLVVALVMVPAALILVLGVLIIELASQIGVVIGDS